MRKCKRCEYTGPEQSFPKAHEVKGVMYYRHVCKSCYGRGKEAYRKGTVQKVREYKKSQHCKRCGFSDYRALTFHHRDRSDKEFNVSNAVSGQSFETVMREIFKCDVLCANCHLILHAEERNGL